MNTKTPSENAVRKKAKRSGCTLKKIPETSRWYNTYGPYMIVNERNGVDSYGMSLEEANVALSD